MRSFNAYFEACRKFNKAFDWKFNIKSWRVHSIELISIISYEIESRNYERKKWEEVKTLNLLNFLASIFDWERKLLITRVTVLFSSHVKSIVWLMLCIHNLKHVESLIKRLIENLIENSIKCLMRSLIAEHVDRWACRMMSRMMSKVMIM